MTDIVMWSVIGLAGICVFIPTALLVGAARVIQNLVRQVGELASRVRQAEQDVFSSVPPAQHPHDATAEGRAQALADIRRLIEMRRQRDAQAVRQAKEETRRRIPPKGLLVKPADVAAGIGTDKEAAMKGQEGENRNE
jgi:uncharacterized membrane protein YccC